MSGPVMMEGSPVWGGSNLMPELRGEALDTYDPEPESVGWKIIILLVLLILLKCINSLHLIQCNIGSA